MNRVGWCPMDIRMRAIWDGVGEMLHVRFFLQKAAWPEVLLQLLTPLGSVIQVTSKRKGVLQSQA